MGFLDFLRRKPRPPEAGGMKGLQEAAEAMGRAGLKFMDRAGLCYRATGDCTGKIRKIGNYPRGSGISATCRITEDTYGCTWMLLEGNLSVALSSAISAYEAVAGAGCGQDFLCAAFAYALGGKKVYWIYSFDGKFYPFIPEGEERDSMAELNLKRAVDRALPVEESLSRWYPVWNLPV